MVRELVAQGHRPVALHRATSNLVGLLGLESETAIADVLDPASLAPALEGCDAVIHLAAVISIDGDRDGRVWRTNVEGVRNVARAALEAGVGRFVHVSSVHAFHVTGEEPFVDETAPRARDTAFAYDRSKAAGEREVRAAIAGGLDAVILNPTGIIGPHDPAGSPSGDFLRSLFRGGVPALVEGGFDFVDVRDVAAATVAALKGGDAGNNFLLSGKWAALADLAHIAGVASGHMRRRVVLPASLARAGLPVLKAWAQLTGTPPIYTAESIAILTNSNRNCVSDKARAQLAFAARPLEETIRDTYAWNREAGLL